MKIAYLITSTEEQRPDRQIDALEPLCDELHTEQLSATSKKRPIFEKVLRKLKSGDTLIVWDLDRIFRSTYDALHHTEELRQRGVEFKIVTLNLDTSEPFGELFFTMVAAFAQFEQRMISKRTKEGMKAAKKRGKHVGRPRKLNDVEIRSASQKLSSGEYTVSEVAALLGVHPRTLSRRIGTPQ